MRSPLANLQTEPRDPGALDELRREATFGKSMTVAELIAALRRLDPGQDLHVSIERSAMVIR